MNEPNKERIGPALGKIPSGIFIATGNFGEEPVGMLSSFVEQCGFEPPSIMIAVQPGRLLHAAIEENGLIGLNILGETDQKLMKPFAQSGNEHPFDGLPLTPNSQGLPQLAEALAFLACRVTGHVASGDHLVYVAEVLDGILQNAEGSPMVRIRRNGFGY